MYAIHLLEEAEQGGGVWLIIMVLVVFFAMVLLGWLASTQGWLKKEVEPTPQAHEAHAPAQAFADDLTILEGIGPKVATVLAGLGITSFAALARADLGVLRTALDAAGYKYMDPSGWIDQAALAAKGDFEHLKKMQDSLKGGRRLA